MADDDDDFADLLEGLDETLGTIRGTNKPAGKSAPSSPAVSVASSSSSASRGAGRGGCGGRGKGRKAATAAASTARTGTGGLGALFAEQRKEQEAVAAVRAVEYKGLVEKGLVKAQPSDGSGEGEEDMDLSSVEVPPEDDDEEEEAIRRRIAGLGGGDSPKGRGGKRRRGAGGEGRRFLDAWDAESDDDVDMDKEELVDWMGITSVFAMADAGTLPTLDFPRGVPEATGWARDPAYRKLHQALRDAGERLPDLLCLMGPARWLQATSAVAPPGLVDWLWKVMAWHPDPAMASGAFRTLKLLLRGEEGLGSYPRGLEGWTLSWDLLTGLLGAYGVELLVHQGDAGATFRDGQPLDTRSLPALGGLAAATAEANTALLSAATSGQEGKQGENQDQDEKGAGKPKKPPPPPPPPPLVKGGVPPTLNLRCLLRALSWCLQDGFFKRDGPSARALLFALLVVSTDRYVQADCPLELREAVGALLRAFPQDSWSTSTLPALVAALLDEDNDSGAAPVRLGTASLVHITRAALSLEQPRGQDLAAHLLRRVLEERVLLPRPPPGQPGAPAPTPSAALVALKALPMQTVEDRQRYLLALLRTLEDPNVAAASAAGAAAGAASSAEGAAEITEGQALLAEGIAGGCGAMEVFDLILYLAYSLALWAQLALVQGDGRNIKLAPLPAGGAAASVASGAPAPAEKGVSLAAEIDKRLMALERARIRRTHEEALQSAKDILAQTAISARALAPQGPTQTKLTSFATADEAAAQG